MATYIITDLFSDQEPLKWELRNKSMRFMSFISETGVAGSAKASELALNAIRDAIKDTITLLELGFHAKLISFMNFSIIKGEYGKCTNVVNSLIAKGVPIKDSVFPQSFFAPEIDKIQKSETPSVFIGQNKGHITEKGHNMSFTSSSVSNSPNMPKKNDRNEAIMQIIKAKGEVSIKDLSLIIKGCSEKTIQRELAVLITRGVLERKGERRWSTYRLRAENSLPDSPVPLSK